MFEVLNFGSFYFWLFSIVFMFVIACCLDVKNHGLAIISLIVYIIILHAFGDVNIVTLCYEYPLYTLYVSLGYITIAAIWGIIKFAMLQSNHANKYAKLRKNFMQKHKIEGDEIPDNLKLELKTYIHNASSYDDPLDLNPSASKYKAEIIGWMMFWPISMIMFALEDLVIKFFQNIYKALTSVFNRIQAYFWSDFSKDGINEDK